MDNSVAEHLANTNKDNNTQIGVYIVDSLDKPIEEVSLEVARHWKIGDSKSNRGVLITIAVKDRKLRIETSNEVSGDLTDVKAKQIIEDVKPELRSNDYSGAVKKMITEVNNIAEHKTDNKDEIPPSFIFWMSVIVIIGIIIALIQTYFENKNDRDNNGGGSGGGDSEHRSRKPRIDSDFTIGLLLGSSFGSSSSSSSSDSDWSSGGWSGGGFDGGGSSGSW